RHAAASGAGALRPSDYIFELKHDGFRAVAYLQNGECKLVSRNQRNLGFEALKRSLANLPVQNAIIDAEVICVDAKGVSQFNQLLSRKGEPVFYAFDLLWLDSEDLRQMPLSSERSDSRDSSTPRSVQGCLCAARHVQHGKGRGQVSLHRAFPSRPSSGQK